MKTVKLANGKTFRIHEAFIQERPGSVILKFRSGARMFAKWYVTVLD